MAMSGHFRISVGELVEQTVRGGDINFRFQSRSSSAEGIKGHQRLQKSRGKDYLAEKSISFEIAKGDITLEVNGRVDGYYPDADPLVVEEIKTLRADPGELPENLQAVHWAQARVYAWALARDTDHTRVAVRLCYLQLDDDTEHRIEREETVESLGVFFESLVNRYLERLRQLHRWRRQRDASIADLGFPHGDYRPGQREMAVSVYRALGYDRQLVIQAPTGIGKTVAAIFPAVKALAEKQHEKLFYVTARTSGQQMAEKTVAKLKEGGLALRDITLTAKEKICFNPGSPCDPDHCEYAKGYYDRLPEAIDATLKDNRSLTRPRIEEQAALFQVCPFELSLDLSRWSDLVICDYNYVFDPAAYLRRYFDEPDGNYGLLIDESHNLVDRGRDMFSAEVLKGSFLDVRHQVKSALPLVAKRLARVNAEILALKRTVVEDLESKGYMAWNEVPVNVVRAMRDFCAAAEDWLKLNEAAPFQETLLNLYFDCLRFIRTADLFDDNFACLLMDNRMGRHGLKGKDLTLKLYCVDPAPLLRQALGRVRATVGFSATMTPQTYFQSLLGLDEDADWYRLASPFASEHLGVFVAGHISTAYRHRQASQDQLVDLIARTVACKSGNYLVFFSSYAYLQTVYETFDARCPDIRTIAQRAGMSDLDRENFLAQFDDEPDETLVGFAVMGGAFGEGIDLQGTRLIGVIIAGVGLPQIGIERDLIRDYFDASGQGFEFAYQYPGMNRVLQTAGRVIRGESDRGIVCLVDTRFAQSRYRALYPPEWQVSSVADNATLFARINAFWSCANERDNDRLTSDHDACPDDADSVADASHARIP